ncbi:hypothetical protein AEW05_15855 [Salmonella enterica subsp. enterica serovar Reading]|nr:hypothetical protein AEU75_01090 [Salmonella enterica subsp. enterica serovar Reading]OCI67513.1 hypothetical protein BBC52_15925 [Salmonella enterica subsp. enterica serovar Muenchen]KNP40585.1 hypothetical protein AEV71_18860 [Salmonella enterica subsp. enterica serovar Reading]KNQ75237.1 hypothetical protein AEW05_15855 [Salmonella enterica subsp. enterica serovar Reading]KNU36351.1 hypothetical protein AEW72_18995 [Salmonella enterica subsp. enterica serovar Reading]
MVMRDQKLQQISLKSLLSHYGAGKKPNPTSRNLPAYQNEYQFMMQQRSVLGWQLKKIVNQRINFIVLSLISAIGSESIYLIKNIYIVW